MAYLKALGIIRLVAHQRDREARAWWKNDTFMLTSSLDRDALVEFFLEEYEPTPIVSPWNGGSGFYTKDNFKAMDAITELELPRFRLWSEVVSTGKKIAVDAEGIDKKGRKEWMLAQCRAKFPDKALDWLDAAYVLTAGGAKYPPLLGTGGNDGRLEFSNNFMQNVVSALNLDKRRNGDALARGRLVAALFNEGSPKLMKKRSTGFYNPGGVGGANASVGFNDDALTNPWDYVLMFEGVLLFAGAAARRLSSQASTKAVFPFTVDNSAAGYGTSADSEYADASRAEFWCPIWNRPASLKELGHLVSEGRAQLGRRQGASGTDFARAVAGLGTERGVTRFQRYGFMLRNGLAYLAVPLGRFYAPSSDGAAESVSMSNLLFDLDGWLGGLRRSASGGNAPAGVGTVLRLVEGAIMDLCQGKRPRDLQETLIAVGRADRWLARSALREKVRPVNLSRGWAEQADDGSPEFRLARALSSILLDQTRQGQLRVGAIRENLEPVDMSKGTVWKDGSVSHVWTAGDDVANMLAVLERRCLEGHMQGMNHPPLDSRYSARLADIVVFLNGDVDVGRMADLALPMSFIRYGRRQSGVDQHAQKPFNAPSGLPTAYAVMKMTLLPVNFRCPEFGADDTDGISIAMEPSMLALLRAGRIGDAYRVAHRRLRASGMQPLSEGPGISDRSDLGRRLAAALLFPLDQRSYCALAQRALRKPDPV